MAGKTISKTKNVTPKNIESAADEVKIVETKEMETATKVATEEAITTVAKAREYTAEDLIPCRSVTQGELLMPGKRSGILYKWFAMGDTIEVEYQDLLALNSSRSSYLYEPYFVIEDEELLSQNRWKGLGDIYKKLYAEQDMDKILNLPPAQLKQMLLKFPDSYKRALAIEVATRIDRGTYDSINRIKVFDEVMNTDLMCLVR